MQRPQNRSDFQKHSSAIPGLARHVQHILLKIGMKTYVLQPKKKLNMLSRISTDRITRRSSQTGSLAKRLCQADCASLILPEAPMRIASSATITARKLRPFTKKHQPSRISAIENPAIAGPRRALR